MQQRIQPDRMRGRNVRASRLLLHAVAMDAAKANMRREGGTVLNAMDRMIGCDMFHRALDDLGGTDAWLAMPRE
jgi:hypothetical protein